MQRRAPSSRHPGAPRREHLLRSTGGRRRRPRRPTFAEDRAFLAAHGTVIELGAPGTGRVLVSPTYQGRVMTSAVGADEPSLGWVHRAFIESGKVGTAFDNYGGEDRFWLGPEAGQFGLYFAPGAPFAFDQWQTPHALQEGAWDEVATGATDRVVFRKTLDVTNWSKAAFSVGVERTVRLLARPEVDALLGTATGEVAFVAFESKNVITNAGRTPWRPETGLLSIWVLGQFAPNDDGRVIVPFEKGGGGPIVNDAYFGAVPKDRLHVDPLSGVLTFSCDGKQRGKIGLGPARAKPVLGSYSAEAGVLTLVTYDGPKRGSPYVDSTWRQQKTPYAGDVVNSYNDGPTAPGQPALGGFYEIETSSAAAALAPGASASHTHRTFHFRGRREALDPIAKRVLGIGLTELP